MDTLITILMFAYVFGSLVLLADWLYTESTPIEERGK